VQRTLGEQRSLASLVLGDLVNSVLIALLASAESLSRLGDVDHLNKISKRGEPEGANL
jgi:hypothetical protein